jgi:hypothetical protein
MDPDTFRPHLNTEFVIASDNGRVGLQLVSVGEPPVVNDVLQFDLILHGPPELQLAQGTYEVSHAQLGSMAWFIVPIVGSNAQRIVYQVCFSAFR